MPAPGHQVARGLGQAQCAQPVDQRRDGLGDEHPAPGLEAEPEGLRGTAGQVGEQGVGEQSREDAQDDRQLLQRAEAAAHLRRADLGDVGGGDHGGRAHAQAADDAPRDEVHDADGQAGADGRDEEEDRRDHHDGHPATALGDRPGEPGADHAAQQGGGDREPGERRPEVELGGERVHRAVDHRGVEAEEEAAQRRGHADAHHPGVQTCRRRREGVLAVRHGVLLLP